jgi:predicted DNA-binding protein
MAETRILPLNDKFSLYYDSVHRDYHIIHLSKGMLVLVCVHSVDKMKQATSKRHVGVRVPIEWIQRLEAMVSSTGRNQSELLQEAIALYLGEPTPDTRNEIEKLRSRLDVIERKLQGLSISLGSPTIPEKARENPLQGASEKVPVQSSHLQDGACPECGSTNVQKVGPVTLRLGVRSQRWQCSDCKHNFSTT